MKKKEFEALPMKQKVVVGQWKHWQIVVEKNPYFVYGFGVFVGDGITCVTIFRQENGTIGYSNPYAALPKMVQRKAESIFKACEKYAQQEHKEYKYQLKPTGYSSQRFGNCEVCGKYASEVFHQIEYRKYSEGWTAHGCRNLFGHEECLREQQKR